MNLNVTKIHNFLCFYGCKDTTFFDLVYGNLFIAIIGSGDVVALSEDKTERHGGSEAVGEGPGLVDGNTLQVLGTTGALGIDGHVQVLGQGAVAESFGLEAMQAHVEGNVNPGSFLTDGWFALAPCCQPKGGNGQEEVKDLSQYRRFILIVGLGYYFFTGRAGREMRNGCSCPSIGSAEHPKSGSPYPSYPVPA